MAAVPRVTDRIMLATEPSTILAALRSDDSEEARNYCLVYESLSDLERSGLSIEEIFTAADIPARRFMEVVCGALWQQGQDVSRMMIAVAVPAVTKATIEAATQPVPVFDPKGNLMGHRPPELKAMEMFHKITGTLPLPKGAQTIINMQQLNQGAQEREESANLQPMDDFLMELKDLKQKRLSAPKQTVDGKKIQPTYAFQEI